MSRTNVRLYGHRPRPHNTYRGSRPQDVKPRRSESLKGYRLILGLSRSDFDRNMEAARNPR